MTPISAIIITLNEEDRIGETVSSVQFCDEVIVVDSGSQDRTREVAAAEGARVILREWADYADQKNFAAGCARNDWVLSVDADERPSERLKAEILHWQREGTVDGCAAYSMPRLAEYLGRWIRHSGWYPDRKIRLYDRRRAHWEGEFVHEGVAVEGPVGRFGGDLLHFPYRSLDDHYRRIERYTALAAQAAASRGRRFSPLRTALGPPAFFLKSFLLQGGFLDGWRGLRIAYMGARYVYLREVRISR